MSTYKIFGNAFFVIGSILVISVDPIESGAIKFMSQESSSTIGSLAAMLFGAGILLSYLSGEGFSVVGGFSAEAGERDDERRALGAACGIFIFVMGLAALIFEYV